MLRTVKTTSNKTITGIVRKDGVLVPHSLTGPAIINEDSSKEYYISGIRYEKSEWKQIIKQRNQKSEDLLPSE